MLGSAFHDLASGRCRSRNHARRWAVIPASAETCTGWAMATRRFLAGAALLLAAVWVAPAGAQQERQGPADPGGAGCPAGQQRGPAGGCVSEDTGSTGVPATAGGGDAGGATSRGTLGTDRAASATAGERPAPP